MRKTIPGNIGSVTRSPVPYFGGKAWLSPRLAAVLPPHRHYVEVCGGSLAVLLAKKPSRQETVNDLDGYLMTFWRVLRDRPDELERVCSLTPHSRAERSLAQEISSELDELEIARRVFVALTQGRSGSLTRTGWRHDLRPVSTPMPVVLQRYAGRIGQAVKRIRGVSLECRPAIEMVESYGGDRGNLLYVDPPYVVDPGIRRGGEYRVEMRSGKAHRELLESCLGADASVVVSGYSSELYDGMLDGWYRYELPMITSQGSGDGRRTEIVWSNRVLAGLGDGGELPLQESAGVTETQHRCVGCSAVLRHPKRGRRRRWCSEACRIAGWRARRELEGDVEVEDNEAAG
ncbi:D12 class N6 adenine-specific DNA methyltransferase [Mycobacteroides abscessus subsp. abscessus]|uniref:DNA adenine methylase n=1 Tax=Mycobacteroides abscessus TaxID=36809 RepID=UPI00092B5B97|nr:DNA adenine methylase [Mycobacteroides abscessus]SHW96306.1 D12 class N6 adenine-specific DNA methyltransferase [Mycobacteroides abscessus subsp. abscessus]SHZ44358.1 D12 class N6 adenine-specific DNA methyltransferase [Mycobacteroides abscessus subsp. abscessus]SIB80444.1 D12 class N6 adenine-specific DNA methyltransferase [Mycobacteroides abscessus subsp. abscessus]SIE54830.1 D12 class N6 adenine-specific DNA methyltransferase [Mycobacteroides abscessus subsp. abscessus]SKI35754.1 D12 cla